VSTWNPERNSWVRGLMLATLLPLVPPALHAEESATLDIEQFTLRITDETGAISHVLRGTACSSSTHSVTSARTTRGWNCGSTGLSTGSGPLRSPCTTLWNSGSNCWA
jgi:hypothetical protein